MYISAGLLNILSKQFEDIRINLPKIFAEFGANIDILKNPASKINTNILGKYLELIVLKKKNPRVGLQAGFQIPFNIAGAIFNLYQGRATVREVFDNIDQLDPTENEICQYSTKVEGDLFHYEITINTEFAKKYPIATRQWYEIQYGIGLQYANCFTGRQLHCVAAYSVYEKEGESDMLEEYLSCPIEFGKDHFALIFNKSILDLPIIPPKRDILPIIEDLMTGIQYNYQKNSLPEEIKKYLFKNISTSDLSLESTAQQFNMSVRSLQRKLKAQNTSYQHILNNIRIELSQKYIKKGLPPTKIAFLLGFESQSSFNKFFRKQFDCSPMQFDS
ncbi:MAG: helix-turn-helix domain-containing protein [Dysgonomonas sp.]|nr:helix-turn-helix domain-containing protein [Dysgonomonas sp.]